MAVIMLIQLYFCRHFYRLYSMFFIQQAFFILQVQQANQCIQLVVSEPLGSVNALWQEKT